MKQNWNVDAVDQIGENKMKKKRLIDNTLRTGDRDHYGWLKKWYD